MPKTNTTTSRSLLGMNNLTRSQGRKSLSIPSFKTTKAAAEKTLFHYVIGYNRAHIFMVDSAVWTRFSKLSGEEGSNPKNQVLLNMQAMIALRAVMSNIVKKPRLEADLDILLDKDNNIFLSSTVFPAGTDRRYLHIRMRKEDSDGDEVSKGGPGVTFHEHHMEDLASQIGGMISNGYQLMQAPTCIYEGRGKRIHYDDNMCAWLCLDEMRYLLGSPKKEHTALEAYSLHRQEVRQNRLKMLEEKKQIEMADREMQLTLLKTVIIAAVENEFLNRSIVNAEGREKTEDGVRMILDCLCSIDVYATFCNVAAALDYPFALGMKLFEELMVPEEKEKMIKYYFNKEELENEEKRMFEMALNDYCTTLP